LAPAPELLTFRAFSMSHGETFGARLRAERERRGISIDTIASVTKVGADLWDGLERNDFSRWPSGIFARAFVRDYARAIGLDADETVNEFCRLFPLGDRRASRLIQAQAQLIGHHLAYAESGGVPVDGDRRSPDRAEFDDALAIRARLASRSLATAIDAAGSLGISGLVSVATGVSFWPVAGMVTVMYYTGMTIAFGSSPGAKAVVAIRHRVPSLFEVAGRRRAHA
jgi:transcriptional regulator with XRE-family HTH domain